MQNDEQESATKRARIDQPQVDAPAYDLADLYRQFADAINCPGEIQLYGSGLYVPSLKRFIKFATCTEKAILQQLVEGVKESKTDVSFPGRAVADFYKSIWHKNMNGDMGKDKGVILLLIEPINNPFVTTNEYTWAGLLTEYLASNNSNFTPLNRSNGVAPYILNLAKEQKLDCGKFGSMQALPLYFRLLAQGTSPNNNSCQSRFICINNHAALGTVIKALAYRVNPANKKYQFTYKDTYDVYIKTGFFYCNTILPYLTHNRIVKTATEIIPLPIQYKAVEKPRVPNVPLKLSCIVGNSLFQPPKPAVVFSLTEEEFFSEIAEHTKGFPQHAINMLARHGLTKEFPDFFKTTTAQRELIRLSFWRNTFIAAKIKQWKTCLKQALDSVLFGYSNYEYKLISLYSDLEAIQSAQPTPLLDSILPRLYWIILNCNEIEQSNLNMEGLTLLKFQNHFGDEGMVWMLKNLWFVLRSIDNKDERRNFLEAGLAELYKESPSNKI